jgi:hypothetical protein
VSLLSLNPLYLRWQCYLRLTTHEHDQALLPVEATRSNHGTSVQNPELELEFLMGQRQEVYCQWENVPEKVRVLAVQRADVPSVGQGAIEDDDDDTRRPGSSRASETRRHKRRR